MHETREYRNEKNKKKQSKGLHLTKQLSDNGLGDIVDNEGSVGQGKNSRYWPKADFLPNVGWILCEGIHVVFHLPECDWLQNTNPSHIFLNSGALIQK